MDVNVQMSGISLIFIISLAGFVSGLEELSSSNLVPCVEGAYLFGEKCYKIFGRNNPQTWQQASESCRSMGGYLASINSKEIQDFLQSFLMLNEDMPLWIGLSDLKTEGKFEWSDGSRSDYSNWKSNTKPQNYYEDCVEMICRGKGEIGKWNDMTCDRELPFICQLNKTTKASSPDIRYCSSEKGGGWAHFDSCYHIIEKKAPWDDAEQFCQDNFGGHLVSIVNIKTEMFLNYILSNKTTNFWIGAKIQDPVHQKWAFGWHVVFNRWSYGQELVNNTCGLRKNNHEWVSENCTQKHPFICETSTRKPPVSKQEWRCPDSSKEWKDLDEDSCYIVKDTRNLNWYEANYDCMTKGGRLATIPSEDVQKAIHHYITDTQDRMFIGLHRKLTDKSTFEWSDGTEVVYQHWEYAEPNNIGEECGELWTHSMTWNDVPCNQKKGYICSAKKLPPISYEENQPAFDTLRQVERHYQSDDTTFKTVMITLVCTAVFCSLVGIVIYLMKTRRIKDIPFSSLRDIIQDRCRFSDMKRSSDNLVE